MLCLQILHRAENFHSKLDNFRLLCNMFPMSNPVFLSNRQKPDPLIHLLYTGQYPSPFHDETRIEPVWSA
uniref:Uncharacterized protein n=1 Tax=Salix viminalis TaxID=40686 RepID=A0A6N2M8R9_SALVM